MARPLRRNEIRALYDRMSTGYDWFSQLFESRATRLAFDQAGELEGLCVLEIGIGTGRNLERVLRSNSTGTTVGLDISPGMIEQTRTRFGSQNLTRPGLIRGEARRLPIQIGSVDRIFCEFVLDLLPEEDISRVLTECERTLKPGGRLVLTTMARGRWPWNRVFEWIYRINPRWMGGCRPVEVVDTLRSCGYTDVRVRTLTQLGFPSRVIRADTPGDSP